MVNSSININSIETKQTNKADRMNKYEVDFLCSDGWFTYDIWANSIFDAAIALMQLDASARITNITFIS